MATNPFQSKHFNIDQLSLVAGAFAKDFPGKTLCTVQSGTPKKFLRSMWEQGITHYAVATLSALKLAHATLPEATICFTCLVKQEHDIEAAYHFYGVRNFSLGSYEELVKLQRATNGAADLTLCVQIDAVLDIKNPVGVATNSLKFRELSFLLTEARQVADTFGIAFRIDAQSILPEAYLHALDAVRALIAHASVTVDLVVVGGWFPFRKPELGQPQLIQYFRAIHRSFEDLPISYSAELWCDPSLTFRRPEKPKAPSFKQNSAAPVFEEDNEGRIGLDWSASSEKLRTDEGALRRHSLARSTLMKALDASQIGSTQCYKISDPISEALKSLGDHPTSTSSETYVVYSKAIRRQMKEILSGQSLKPPLSEEQVDRLQEWMDADAAFVSLDDWLAKVENAIYERRFGSVASERLVLEEMIEAIRSHDAANADAQNVLIASVDSLPENLGPQDVDAKLASETNGNFWRQVGRVLHRGWTGGKAIAPKLWKLAQWAAERTAYLKEKVPGLSSIWDFIEGIAGKGQ